MAHVLDYDKVNKIIEVSTSYGTEITIQNLLNDIRDFEDELSSMDIPFLASAAGKEALGGGVAVGLTLTLLDGWKLAFEARLGPAYTQCSVSGGNLVTINETNPIHPTAFTQIVVTASSSATTSDLEAIQYASYQNAVWLSTMGVSGTNYPIGTPISPVNNINDAHTIAENNGFTRFEFLTDWNFSNTILLDNYIFGGEGPGRTHFVFDNTSYLPRIVIEKAKISGEIEGLAGADFCLISNLLFLDSSTISDRNIKIEQTLFDNELVLSNDFNGTLKILDCWSNVPGSETPIINLNDASCDIFLRNYSGGIKIENASQSINSASIDLTSGQIKLADTVTAGFFTCRGVGYITDDSSGAIVNVSGLMSKETVADAVLGTELTGYNTDFTVATSLQLAAYQDAVWVNVNADLVSSTGTYPFGTKELPVNTVEDAIVIASGIGIKTIAFIGDYTFDSSISEPGLTFVGEGDTKSRFTFHDGGSLIIPNLTLLECTMSGIIGGLSDVENSHIIDLTIANYDTSIMSEFSIRNTLIEGTLAIDTDYDDIIQMLNCWAMPDASGNPPVFDHGNSGSSLQVRNLSGFINIKNVTEEVDIRVFLNSGGIVLEDSVTAGNFVLTGVGTFINDASGLVVIDSDALLSKEIIINSIDDAIGAEIQYASYQNAVWFDPIDGSSGTEYPIGTAVLPSNNWGDALAIANKVGFFTINILNDTSINGSVDISGFKLVGKSDVDTKVDIITSANVQNITIENCDISGVLDGGTQITGCIVGNISYVNGHIHNSGLYGNIKLDGNLDALFANCRSIDGTDIPIIDMGGSGQNLSISNFSGQININNLTGFQTVGIGLDAAQVTLDSTMVGGLAIIGGIGTVIDNSSPGCLVNLEGLMSKETIADAVLDTDLTTYSTEFTVATSLQLAAYSDAIWVDNIDGSHGSSYPYGTKELPVEHVEDAVLIAQSLGIHNIRIKGDYVFDSSILVTGLTFIGDGNQLSHFTFPTKMIITNSIIKSAEINGWLSGVNLIDDCHLIDFGSDTFVPSNSEIQIKNTLIEGTLTLPNTYSGVLQVLNCWAMADASGNPPIFDHGNSGSSLQVRNLSGFINIKNVTEEVDIRVFLNSGGIVLEDSITAGNFVLTGVGTLDDSVGGTAVLNTDALLSKEIITSAIWDELVIKHLNAGSFGDAIADLLTAGGSLTPTQSIQLEELYKLQGLDINFPMTVTPDLRTVDDIDLELTGDGETSTIVTRQ